METPVIKKKKGISPIWILPIIALIIGGWLLYDSYKNAGVDIVVHFPDAEGITIGKSEVIYKGISIGVVRDIAVDPGVDSVSLQIEIKKVAAHGMVKDTKFWIVKPEVGVSGVSGLDTLISGTYINMFAQKNGNYKENFLGLDHAYRNIGGGEYFVLNTPRGDSSVKVGTPIYLKNVKVGQVEYVVLALDDASVDVIVFIDKRYVPYVHTDSNFWVRSTLDVGLQNGNLDITVAPVTDLIQGAIEFSTTGKEHNRSVPNSFVFELYKNKNIIKSKKVGQGGEYIKTFMLHTEGSIAKLKENAAVRYEGFDVGKVKKISLSYEKSTHKMRGKVLVEIDTSVFKDMNDTQHTGEENLYQAVKEGLRAQIVPTDIITGMLYVDLVFDCNDTTGMITKEGKYARLPTIGYRSGNIMASATKILDKINKLPLEKLLVSLNKVVDESAKPVANANAVLLDLKKTVANLNKMTNKRSFAAMPDEVSRMLKELTRTLQTTKKVVKGYDSNSLITKQLSQTLKIVTETSKEMQQFLEMLNRKPNSLIFGDH